MDSKRKANGAGTPDSDDRAAKRRKIAVSLPALRQTLDTLQVQRMSYSRFSDATAP